MTALAADRRLQEAASAAKRYRVGKVAAGVKIFKGAHLCSNLTGFLVPAADTRGFKSAGIAAEFVDNTLGVDGAVEAKYFTGLSVKMKNDGTSPITQANLLRTACYVKDDQTVQSANSNGVVAGVPESIDTDGGVYVYVSPEIAIALEGPSDPIETVVTATALSLFARVSLLAPVGTMAMPLPAGRFVGHSKTIRQIGGSGTPISNVTGLFTTDGVATTQAQFNANADQLEAVWNGTAWQVLANTSVTMS